MGGCRCSYKHCSNTTKTRENLHFFHYPVKQKDRCRKWIENANKPQFFNLDEDQLRNKVVCETHFEDSYFPNVQRKRLLQGAVPTLEGDSIIATSRPPPSPRKLSDVQVLPANADGTIFVLEANHLQNNYCSEKVESYIYTNSGLVLPIKKCVDIDDDDDEEEERCKEEANEIEEFLPPPPPPAKKLKILRNTLLTAATVVDPNEEREPVFEQVNYVFSNKVKAPSFQPKAVDPIATASTNHQREEVVEVEAAVHNKYLLKRIDQNSKDIAILKRMVKSKSRSQNVNVIAPLTALRRHIPPTLYDVLRLNVRENSEPSSGSLDFFSDIYNTSPSLYKLFIEKYKWKLPSPQTVLSSTKNKSNGHICKSSGVVELEKAVLPD